MYISSRLPFCIGLLLLLSVAGCDDTSSTVRNEPPTVFVQHPEQRNVALREVCPGLTQAIRSVAITPQITGTLEKVLYAPGSFVTEGTPLFTLQHNSASARLAAAEAELAGQKALRSQAALEYERNRTLYKAQAVSQSTFVSWQERLASAEAGVKQAEASVKQAQIDLAYTVITAPFSGRMSKASVDPGALVGPTTGPLATLSAIDPIYALFSMNPEGAPFLKEHGSELFLAIGDGPFAYPGTLEYMAPEIDSASGTLLMRGTFPNPERALLPGQYVRIQLTTGWLTNALIVPLEALNRDQNGPYLLTLSPENTVRRTTVATGPQIGSELVIMQGITLHDRVITTGMERIRPGEKVIVSEQR